MAVYVTSRMFNKLNNAKYPSNVQYIDDGSCTSDHWQKLFSDSQAAERLSKDNICRVCAGRATTPLTDKIYNYDIMSAIRSITNVTVDIEDSLPKYICNECLETLKISWLFKKKCESSDRKFKTILNPMGDPSLHSYPYSKHDFQLILHQMKLKRTKIAEKREMERRKKERMLEKKNPKVKQFKCSPCDMIFANKESLVSHRRQRQCMRRACDICGQLVLSISQHMRHIHKESVPHRCPTCGKEFPIIARLKHHMVVHTNTFNFFCDLCPYKCKHKYYLVMHMRTHTGEKPYKCGDCPATFVNPSNLNKHKLIHQDKQFKCMLCEKAFRTSSVLREHHEAAHMNIKHTCNFCGRDFCYKSDLRKHEIRSHNRSKRDYVGGEPTYKQVERLQKMQDNTDGPTLMEKWHQEVVTVTQPTPVVQATYIDQSANTHTMYFSDLSGTLHQPQLVQQPLENVTLSDLLKKDPAKIYESQQTIGYF